MKIKGISFLIIAIIVLCGIGLNFFAESKNEEYLRIHVRANSNEETDQAVKYLVKDKVVSYLTPFIAECDTKEKAKTLLTDRLTEIKSVADQTLKQNGYDYEAKVSVKNEKFPTRVYGDLELDEGYYDALIIELGKGDGNNWWCVVYPPLCFTGEGQTYQIRSKILDVIRNFYNKEK